MPTVSEPVDQELRAGKTRSLCECFIDGLIGEDTLRCSLSILRYEKEEIKDIIDYVYTLRKVKIGR